MSPVSPTFVTPLASSSIRLGSPSKDTIGNEPAGESVRSTTNSCVSVPELVTMNETVPSEAKGRDRSMNMWVAIGLAEADDDRLIGRCVSLRGRRGGSFARPCSRG